LGINSINGGVGLAGYCIGPAGEAPVGISLIFDIFGDRKCSQYSMSEYRFLWALSV
jgi:hypothetical protein